MGVPGLWDILNRTGRSRSLAHLAITDGFEKNANRLRGYRLGIDTSIWLHHASSTVQGENPELRGLFFRLVLLAKMPIIPLFIFDGRERPKVKRNSRLGKSGSHALARQFKKFIDAFGMEWREAPAEAEAELAHLNKEGHIDAILTDDCDAFIFGAQTVIKNISKNLPGNKNNLATNSAGKTDEYHTMVYKAVDIENDPVVGMSRGGLILFALLSGGDYHKGVEKVGKKIAHAMARSGFGDQLLDAYQRLSTQEFQQFLGPWRIRVNHELRQNEMGFLPHRTSLSLPNDFPELEILDKYAQPNYSGRKRSGMSTSVALRDRRDRDLGEIGRLCEEHFEWGYRTKIIERFRNFMWPCAVIHVLRRASLEADEKERSSRSMSHPGSRAPPYTVIGTSNSLVKKYLGAAERADGIADLFVNRDVSQREDSLPQSQTEVHSLITNIVGARNHASTDALLEYRVEVCPVQLILLTDAGIRGRRQSLPEKATSKVPPDPNSTLRMWIPAPMIHAVCPDLEEQYLSGQRKKGEGKRRARTPEFTSSPTPRPFPSSPPTERPKNIASQGNPKAQILQPLSETAPFRKTVILDPWFTSQIPQSIYEVKASSMDFLFTFRNPDDEQDEPGSGSFTQASFDLHEGDQDGDGLGTQHPGSSLGHLWGQILDAPIATRRRPKKRASTQPFVDQSDARPNKRRKTINDILDLT